MPFVEALRLALSSVWSHKLRSFLTRTWRKNAPKKWLKEYEAAQKASG